MENVRYSRLSVPIFSSLMVYMQVVDDLRERYFGKELELSSHKNYHNVWALDKQNFANTGDGAYESIQDLVDRVTCFLKVTNEHEGNFADNELHCLYSLLLSTQLFFALQMTENENGKNFIVVSHGDTLSVMSALLSGTPIERFREFGMKNCQIREFHA